MDDEQVPESFKHKTTAQKVRDFILPSGVEAIFYLVLASTLLLALNAQTVWGLLNNSEVALTDDYLIKQQLESLNEGIGSFVVFGIWLGIGSMCYLVIWALQNIAHRAKIDAQGANNIGVADSKSYWQSVFAHYFAFVSVTIGCLLYVLICLRYLLPAFLSMTNNALQNLSVAGSYVDLMFAIIGMSCMLYVFHLIWNVTRYVWHTIRIAD